MLDVRYQVCFIDRFGVTFRDCFRNVTLVRNRTQGIILNNQLLLGGKLGEYEMCSVPSSTGFT